jgi:hypothetical protein
LCERPFDQASLSHVNALLAYVQGDAQKADASAKKEVLQEISSVRELDLDFFSEGSRVREHVHRLDPSIEAQLAVFTQSINNLQEKSIGALESKSAIRPFATGTLKRIARAESLSSEWQRRVRAANAIVFEQAFSTRHLHYRILYDPPCCG